jgi:cobalamin-dependent methionine synthase I
VIDNRRQKVRLKIAAAAVLARLGFSKDTTVLDAATAAMIAQETECAHALIIPRQAIAHAPVCRVKTNVISLSPGLVISSAHIAQLLAGCDVAYGFAVTIGPHLEEKRNLYLSRKETSRALVLDAIGSVAAEELAGLTHQEIRTHAAAQKMAATPRYSPGYGDWGLTAQPDFLKWLAAEQIGIHLNDHCQMIPEKSVSAIVGIRSQ